MRHASLKAPVLVLLLMLGGAAAPDAQRTGYPPEEFAARRMRLAKTLERGTLMLFGSTEPLPGLRFRQDNDFYYLTGSEALNAVLVMDAPSGASHLFMPKQSATEIRYEGANWLEEPGAAAKYGFASIQPLTALHEFLARRRSSDTEILWTRLSERDYVSDGRTDVAIHTARRLSNPFAQQPSEDAARAAALRRLFPFYELRDVTPHLDRLRLIKTPREIEILRRNGRISAEAIARAIRATAPGRYEYELEAEATHWMLKHGIQSAAYPAIVASGPNGNQWHYNANGRRMNAGELVVMDYGGSLDYLTIDITRTWPVSGHFTDRQLKAYQAALEAQKAIIAAIRPGVARSVVRTIAEDIFRAHGFDPRYAYVGHYVGLSVHDVGDWSLPFEAGMVMAIEPIIDIPAEQLHIRIEDTILVTPDGAEVLSAAVPKEVDELLALLRPTAP
ncbi:MAG TPA: Xaa-Pro peptidase family protein [Vicinamibacterales bacterium]|nr:Xaa-Pro peptidase family protein [Vicinamibacterales bacterium]